MNVCINVDPWGGGTKSNCSYFLLLQAKATSSDLTGDSVVSCFGMIQWVSCEQNKLNFLYRNLDRITIHCERLLLPITLQLVMFCKYFWWKKSAKNHCPFSEWQHRRHWSALNNCLHSELFPLEGHLTYHLLNIIILDHRHFPVCIVDSRKVAAFGRFTKGKMTTD